MTAASHPGVNVIGMAASANGNGLSARMAADLLIAEGVPLAIVPVASRFAPPVDDADLDPYRRFFSREPVYGINLFVFGAHFATDRFPQLRQPMRVDQRFNVLLPFWELEEYPDSFLQLRESFQLFLTPTRFVHDGLAAAMPGAPLHYLPTAALQVPPPRETRSEDLERPFRFFFNFDIASSLQRKQPGLLVDAYTELFGGDPSTELLLKVSGAAGPQGAAVVEHLERLRAKAPGLKIVTDLLPRHEMLDLIAGSDAYVSCHRSEGLGLGLLEAMAMGVPCIATGFGGNTDFMTRDNSLLIDYEMEEVRCPIYLRLLGRPGLWAQPLRAHLLQAMAAMRSDAALRERLSAAGRRDALKYIDVSWKGGLGRLLAQRFAGG